MDVFIFYFPSLVYESAEPKILECECKKFPVETLSIT